MADYHAQAVINTSNGSEIIWGVDVQLANDTEDAKAAVREILIAMNIDPTNIMYIEIS